MIIGSPHYIKYARIRVITEPYCPVYGQNRRFCPYAEFLLNKTWSLQINWEKQHTSVSSPIWLSTDTNGTYQQFYVWLGKPNHTQLKLLVGYLSFRWVITMFKKYLKTLIEGLMVLIIIIKSWHLIGQD